MSLLEMEILPQVPWDDPGLPEISQEWMGPTVGHVLAETEGMVRGISKRSTSAP